MQCKIMKKKSKHIYFLIVYATVSCLNVVGVKCFIYVKVALN